MQVIPAVDILGGECARLEQGEYSKAEYFKASPLDAARAFARAGASLIHVVDLDGAREGRLVNFLQIKQIPSVAKIQIGGGIRTADDLEKVFSIGAKAVVSTSAVESASFREKLAECKESVLLAVDARGGKIALGGWKNQTQLDAFEFAGENRQMCGGIVFTSISRDGMMEGPDFEAIGKMQKAVSVPLIAAGGVSSYEDIAQLAKMGISGCIIGKALYSGAISLEEAMRVAR